MRWAILTLLWLMSAQVALGAEVIVTVTGVRDNRGTVRVAICARADFLKPVCPYHSRTPAQAGAVVVAVQGVPPGQYAAEAYQDANDNGILDRNWLGFPEEGMGFSHDARFWLGPPSFDDAAFSVTPTGSRISLPIRYY